MLSDGWRVDPHVKVLDERVVARAKDRGLDGLVYAPHFTQLPAIQERSRAFSDDGLTVYPAREIFTGTWRDRRHVLAVGLTEPVPDFITLDGAFAELRRQGATVLAPHPTFVSVSLTADELARYREDIHAIEVYNPKHWPHHNRRARRLANDLGLPVFGSSYAHLRGTVGEVWTSFPEELPDTPSLGRALRDPETERHVSHRSGRGHRGRCALEFGHLFWENSWEKLDRVLLSSREATHPDDPVYDGRFDNVAAYGDAAGSTSHAGDPDPGD